MTEVVTKVQKLRIYRPKKTQFESVSPDPYAVYAVDPEFAGSKLLATDSDGDIVESTIDPSTVEQKATIETLDTTDSITLTDNTIFNGGTQTALTIALWSTPTVSSLCEVVFSSGSTATTMSYPNTIQWLGDDVTSNVFTPVVSKRYTIIFYYDGNSTVGVVKGVE